jgi:hypothetical protein
MICNERVLIILPLPALERDYTFRETQMLDLVRHTPMLILHIFVLSIKYTAFFQTPEQFWFEKLADRNVLRKTLPPSRLQYEIAC